MRCMLIVAAACALLPGHGWCMDIVKDGKPVAAIVTPDNPDAVAKEAARLLQMYVKEATQATLPIVEEAAAPAGNRIFIGATKSAGTLGLSTDKLPGDSYFMRCKGNALWLFGRDDKDAQPQSSSGAKGTMRAVLDFLRDHAGVRWILPCPQGTWVPKANNLAAPEGLSVNYVPNMLYATSRLDRFYPWSLANGARMSVKLMTAGGHTWCYAFPNLEHLRSRTDLKDKNEQIAAAIEEFARKNPEVYALVGGKRLNTPDAYGKKEGYSPYLCTSHPDFVPAMARWIRQKFDEGYDIVQLGESDGMRHCECDRCNAQFGPMSRTEPQRTEAIGKRIFIPHKAVMEECYKSHPNKYVMLLVYAGARPFLTGEKDYGIRFPPNAVAEATNAAPDQLDALKKIFPSEQMYGRYWVVSLYNYWWSPYHGGLSPKQTPETIAAQMQKVLKYKMFGNYFCGGAENFAAEGPTYYVCLRTMEQPHLTPEQLLKEYCQGLYGKAANTMVAYYKALYEHVKGNPGSGTPGMGAYGSNAETRHRMKYLTCWPSAKREALERLLATAKGEAAEDARAASFIRLAYIGYEQIHYTARAFEAQDALEKQPSPENQKKVKTALDERWAWIQKIRNLKNTDAVFVRDFFPNFDRYITFLEDEGARQSPLNKPFKDYKGPVAPDPG